MLLAVSPLLFSCGMQGDFGFKKFGDDTYRRIDGKAEFPAGEEVEWVFLFKKNYGVRLIGIIYQKKELVWVDVRTDSASISELKKSMPAVYGTIKDLPPGDYRLVVTDVRDDNRIIAAKEFSIYQDDEEDNDGRPIVTP